MVEPTNGTVVSNSSCPNSTAESPIHLNYFEPNIGDGEKFPWTEEQQGNLLGCFFYGYAATVGPFGLLADMLGARYLIFFSLAGSSICGLLYPICARWGYGYLVAIRVIQGLVQGGIFPPQTSMWGRWSPTKERTILLGISGSISLLGNIFSNALTVLICENLGWEWTFYIYSMFGLFFSFIWVIYFRNSPEEMPWISSEERAEIEAGSEGTETKIPFSAIPFRKIFTSVSFLAVCYSGITGTVQEVG